ncbi:MAG: carboxylesterase/lipase family protein, partial [Planctomycetota bacterium]
MALALLSGCDGSPDEVDADSGVPDVDSGQNGELDAAPGLATDLASALVATRDGPIQGEATEGLAIFRGIPYLAPPVASLRWAPPQSPQPWQDTQNTTAFGAACPQPSSEFLPGFEPGVQNEDCLFANVWTPATASGENLPVMVSIHGGGYTIGSGSSEVFEATKLATRGDVVVVTFNYRLGPLGFFSHPHLTAEGQGTSGNYGLRDQVAMLEWVRDNAAEFGGDPDNVTIFGESAGGGSVCYLLASPLAKGLFHRAIIQSADCFTPQRRLSVDAELPSAESLGTTVSDNLSCEGTAEEVLECMRSASFEDIAAAGNLASGAFAQGEKFWPIIDGEVIPAPVAELVSSNQHNRVPTITGTTAREAALFRAAYQQVNTRARFRFTVATVFGDNAPAVLAMYPVDLD